MDCFSRADPLGGERKAGRGWNKSPDPTSLTIMKCEICGTVHEKYQAHKFASNTASNVNASNPVYILDTCDTRTKIAPTGR
jgi:hypothetical protein